MWCTDPDGVNAYPLLGGGLGGGECIALGAFAVGDEDHDFELLFTFVIHAGRGFDGVAYGSPRTPTGIDPGSIKQHPCGGGIQCQGALNEGVTGKNNQTDAITGETVEH